MTKEDPRRTWEGLRADGDCPTLDVSDSDKMARDTDGRVATREEAKWLALFDAGLVNMETVPEPREELKWVGRDDVEVRVLLRAKGGATVGEMLDDATYPRADIVRALCRLASRGLLRLP